MHEYKWKKLGQTLDVTQQLSADTITKSSTIESDLMKWLNEFTTKYNTYCLSRLSNYQKYVFTLYFFPLQQTVIP